MLVSSYQGTMIDSQPLTVQSYPAQESSFTMIGLNGTLLTVLDGNRLFMLMTMSQPSVAVYPDHFFDTFEIK
jgi:hypothetical protein